MAIEIKSGDLLPLESFNNHLKINAGPGAGKTHFLVENVKNLIHEHPAIVKSNIKKIVCITYTNAAVEEIERRLDNVHDYVESYTIHSFIYEHIIKPFQQDLKRIILDLFSISIDENTKISSQIEGLGILHGIDKKEIYEYILNFTKENADISYSKKIMGEVEIDNDLYLSTEKIDFTASNRIARNHIIPLKSYIWSKVGKLTHNEILFFGYQILKRNPVALYSIRVHFPFIFVDEFQDTNPLQTLLLKLIGEKSTVIGVIGDIAQSIYSFQGARPKQFEEFSIYGSRQVVEYEIKGNRRSTCNIVNLCNFLRGADTLIQNSIREYKTDREKESAESQKIHFLLGNSETIRNHIKSILIDGGVVLTRTWVAAFSHIQEISESQKSLLTSIYNSYFNSPIDIRAEIIDKNNVTWVRAFKFIFTLWSAYKNNSFNDVINAFSLYIKINRSIFNPKIVFQTKNLSDKLFGNLSQSDLTKTKIDQFNVLLRENEFAELRDTLFGNDFHVAVFTEDDKEALINAVSQLDWQTSFKLFTEVFTQDSKYLTVHQAKGLEWKKVIVSVTPSARNDKTTLSKMFESPNVLNESPEDEFTRIYYVACSRAIEDLYIHINDASLSASMLSTVLENFKHKSGLDISYEMLS